MRSAQHPPRIAVLMPARNEGHALGDTLRSLVAAASVGAERTITVFLVDDGSDPVITESSLPAPTLAFSVVLARHVTNLGQGAALETARQLAVRDGFDAYVTMDSDGQHSAADALALAHEIFLGADAAFGNRFLGDSNVPKARALLLFFARWFERALTGLPLADAHNGLRAFSHRAARQIVIQQNRMAHATEIKLRVAGAPSLSVVEVPVSVRYSARTLAKGQSAFGAGRIVLDLALQYFFGEAS
jgi:glycosyltransferase involved in cell wall biosynthesis